jgi:CHAD domain-containing protein
VGKDIEGVHQMRVGLRRFRSCLTLFAKVLPRRLTKNLRGDLKALTGPLGGARDWDVFLAEHVRPMTKGLPENHPLQALRAAAEQRRLDLYTGLHRTLQSTEYHQLILKCTAWLARREWRAGMTADERMLFVGPFRQFASSVLAREHKRILKKGADLAGMDEESRHRLRINIKKQRYAVEFFESLYPRKAARRYRNALRDLQDLLGHYNDAATATTLLAELNQDGISPETLASVEGWYAHARLELDRRLMPAWSAFTGKKRFWR